MATTFFFKIACDRADTVSEHLPTARNFGRHNSECNHSRHRALGDLKGVSLAPRSSRSASPNSTEDFLYNRSRPARRSHAGTAGLHHDYYPTGSGRSSCSARPWLSRTVARGARPGNGRVFAEWRGKWMKQADIDAENSAFWTTLCGTNFAKTIGVSDDLPASLKRFDDWYFAFYPYLFIHIPFDEFTVRMFRGRPGLRHRLSAYCRSRSPLLRA